MAAHFQAVGDDVLATAPIGMLGAVAVGAFIAMLARRLHRGGQVGAAALVASGGLLVAGYLIALHVVYASIAYSVAGSSADVTKGLFVATIVATVVWGLGTALTLGAAACGAARAGLLPRWWHAVSLAGAGCAAVATVSYADSGFFSPDVQQQVVAGVTALWLLVTAVASTRGSAPLSA